MTAGDKRRRLQALFRSQSPILLAGAHSGLGARLVEDAGFDGVWASGFELSASRAVPDASIITMDDMLDASRCMNDACRVPVIADCDTGYGNSINVIRAVKAFEAAGVAGISIEDSTFPKRCSFYAGVKRQLVDAAEFALKVRAAVDTRTDAAFVVIARTEAFVAGGELEDALQRARAYADAGADAVLVHSKHPTPDQVARFAARWDRPTPLVCVPTTYDTASASELAQLGFKVIIFANQALRASVMAMQRTLRAIRQTGTGASVQHEIAPLSEIYHLVDLAALKADECRYLPDMRGQSPVPVVIVPESTLRAPGRQGDAQAQGGPTDVRAVVNRQIEVLRQAGIPQITIAGGDAHVGAAPGAGGILRLLGEQAEQWGSVIVLFRDVVFDRHLIERLHASDADLSLVCDRSWPEVRGGDAQDVLVIEAPNPRAHRRFLSDTQDVVIAALGPGVTPASATAELVGLARLTPAGCRSLLDVQATLVREQPEEEPAGISTDFKVLFAEAVRRGQRVSSVGIYQGWAEIGHPERNTVSAADGGHGGRSGR